MICRICKKDKNQECFNRRTPGSFRTECKECSNSLKKEQYEARKLREKTEVFSKACARCEKTKSKDEFRKHPATSDGLDRLCKSCMSAYHQSDTIKKYLLQKKLSGKQKIILDKYRKSRSCQISGRRRQTREVFLHPIRLAEANMRSELRRKVHDIMGGKCLVCAEDRSERLCIDHVNDDGAQERLSTSGNFRCIATKIVRGGEWKGKYQLLCFNCNRRKQLAKIEADKSKRLPNHNLCGEKTCTQCQRSLPMSMYTMDKGRLKSYCKDCGCSYNARRKRACIDKLGGNCVMCGEKDLSVLEVDHINNDGSEIRKTGKDRSIASKVSSGSRNTDDLQVLCCNCNAAKGYAALKDKAEAVFERKLLTEGSVAVQDFELRALSVEELPIDQAKSFLQQYHYAGYGRSGKACYGAKIDGELVFVAKIAPVTRKEVATSMGASYDRVVELDRFCINPKFQKKNLASFALSKVVLMIRKKFPDIEHIVSFADTEQGHKGTIYAACNWERVGTTAPSYCYMGGQGNIVNKKTLYGRAIRQGMTENEYAHFYQYTKVNTSPKIKFVKHLRQQCTFQHENC